LMMNRRSQTAATAEGDELFLVKLVLAFPAEAEAFVAVALEAEAGEA